MTERAKDLTIGGPLVEALWSEIKASRDEAEQAARDWANHAERLNRLLDRMKASGMADWIPTIEEVQAAWRDAPGETPPTTGET